MANEEQRRAFISYSRINKEFTTKLVKGLRSGGYPVWFDLMDIPTGSRWDDEVEKALRECSIFMIILTPASIASENVKDEIGYAIDHGKRILPVLLEECDVPLRLRRFQYVDFTTKSFEEGFESAKELLGDLIQEVSVPVSATTFMAETPVESKPKPVKAQSASAAPVKKMDAESTISKKPAFNVRTAVIAIVGILVVAVVGIKTLGGKNTASCAYQGSTDDLTFQNLVLAEEKANLDEDISIIQSIFSSNAVVIFGDQVEDPITHYEAGFKQRDFVELTHYDFNTVKNTGNKAWMEVSDNGRFVWTDTGEEVYYNGVDAPLGTHIIFEKDASGCWLISEFTIGASGQAFP